MNVTTSVGPDVVEQALDEPRYGQRRDEAEGLPITVSRSPHDQPQHIAAACAERHADAELARTLADRVRDYAVDPD